MNQFARIIVGYHGCKESFAHRLIRGEVAIQDWAPSENDYDWLGHGIYFWEHAPARAFRWASKKAENWGGEKPAVVGALIQLGDCLDLTNERNTTNLRKSYEQLIEDFESVGKPLPQNVGGSDLKGRYLDCLVINTFRKRVSKVDYQTVRAAFTEGSPVYDGSMFMEETHVQVAVLDHSCILGVFRPT